MDINIYMYSELEILLTEKEISLNFSQDVSLQHAVPGVQLPLC